MGMQIVWTSYGQAIFEEKLTTIANDLRVFTFNLFHNYLINQLYKNYPEEIQNAKSTLFIPNIPLLLLSGLFFNL